MALLYRGRTPTDPLSARLEPMAAALDMAGMSVEPVAYGDSWAAAVIRRLVDVAGVLVWADPISDEGDRRRLDQVLREAAAAGVWLGSHPDVIDRIGTKEVLVTTRDLGWGSDSHLYRTREELRREFPRRLAADGVRVLKASRGNGGRTVWKVQLPHGPASAREVPVHASVRVQHARVRDSSATLMSMAEVLAVAGEVFEAWDGTGRLVDQEFVAGITRGIVRCYLVGGRVVGFARQYPDGARPRGALDTLPAPGSTPDAVMGLPSAKTMYPPGEPALAELRESLETDWVPGMMSQLGLEVDRLPALWDVDLLLADPADPKRAAPARFVLCEINASSVIPFPPESPTQVAAHVSEAIGRRNRDRS
ncbi:MAG TPA: Cj0069 family protein [Actinomycetes bacterium]|nr:Cj0069 family protein [Actinomycetes bacterium]